MIYLLVMDNRVPESGYQPAGNYSEEWKAWDAFQERYLNQPNAHVHLWEAETWQPQEDKIIILSHYYWRSGKWEKIEQELV